MADKDEEPTAAAAANTEGDATLPAAAVEGKEGGKAKGKGKGGKGASPRKSSALTKEKALAQINSLDPDDDEREAMSKKISWILRKGYSRIGIEATHGDWIKFEDLLNCDLLEVPDKSEEKLMSVIDESNQQKLRYEIKESDNGKLIRALKKEERKSKGGHEPGEKRRPAEGWQAQQAYGAPLDSSKLNGDAAAFVPGQGGAAAAANPMAAYQMAYMAQAYGMGFNPYSMYGYGGAYAAAQAAAAAPKAAAKDDPSRRFQGRIKSFNVEKGYGFIESSQSYDVYGRDVFLHKAHLGEKEVGAFVSFTVEMNKSGMPQGRDLAASDGSMAKGSKGKGKGKGKKGEGKGEGKKKGDKKDDKKEGDEAKESEETAAKAAEDVDAK